MNRSNSLILAIAIVGLILCISCTCLILGLGALYLLTQPDFMGEISANALNTPTNTPDIVRPTIIATPAIPSTPGSAGLALTVPGVFTETQAAFEGAIVPINDPLELAQRFEGKTNLVTTVQPPAAPLQLGARQEFWVLNTDVNQFRQAQATLRHITDHVYFWVEDGIEYGQDDLSKLVETFESQIYPTNREFFGSEWTPGVDGDPHLYILYANSLGGPVAGYYASSDEYLPEVSEYSNAHEMFFLSADRTGLDEEFTYGVLAHEFQHMIHWYRDLNEDTWMNEGFADLAMFLNGYTIGGADRSYVSNPDIQFTNWPVDNSDTSPYYGASFLFLNYFLGRFGEEATKALVANPANGMTSIDGVLAEMSVTDSLTGQTISADDVFADWVVASYLQDEQISDGRYTYHDYPRAPNPGETETIRDCPTEQNVRDVSQYGVDYIRIRCPGGFNLHWEGSVQVNALPVDPHSGSYTFFSNKGDESHMTLTRTFDFSNASGPLTLKYWTWYDIEKDYDYLYLTASTDGQTWEILKTPSGTSDDPSGNSYGWAYNGQSGGGPRWIEESVDLSQFAGKQVELGFEYITDDAANGEGFLLDDVSIPEIGYSTDFEKDDGGWLANGFVRIQNIMPQTFRLSLINKGRDTTVQTVKIAADNSADIPLQIGGDVEEVILVVSGTTRFTGQRAGYQFIIRP